MSRHSAEMPSHFPCNNSERTCPATVRSTTASPFSIREIWNYLECVGVFGLEVDFSNLLRREGVLRGRAKHDVVSWPDTEEVPEAEVANQSPQAMSVEAISQRAFKPEPRSQSPGPTSHESRSQNPESTSQRSLCRADFGRTEDQVEKKGALSVDEGNAVDDTDGGGMELGEGRGALPPSAPTPIDTYFTPEEKGGLDVWGVPAPRHVACICHQVLGMPYLRYAICTNTNAATATTTTTPTPAHHTMFRTKPVNAEPQSVHDCDPPRLRDGCARSQLRLQMVLRQRMARKPASLGVAGFATRRTSMSSLCITFPFYIGGDHF